MAAWVIFVLVSILLGVSQAVQVSKGPRLQYQPDTHSISCTVNLGRSNPLKGPGIPKWFGIEYRDVTSQGAWQASGEAVPYPDTSHGDYNKAFQIIHVDPNKEYEVRVILQDTYGVVYGANDVAASSVFTGSAYENGSLELTYGPELKYEPDIPAISCKVTLGRANPLKGSGYPRFYQIQYRKKDSGQPWQQYGADQTYPDITRQDYTQTFEITGVEHDKEYEVRIVTKDSNGVVYGSNDVPSSTIFTGDGGLELTYGPELKYEPDIPAISCKVTLGPDNRLKGSGNPMYYQIQYRKKDSDQPWQQHGVDQTYPDIARPGLHSKDYTQTFEITGVEHDKEYEVRIVVKDSNGVVYGSNDVPSSTIFTGNGGTRSGGLELTYGPELKYEPDIPAISCKVTLGRANPLKGTGYPRFYQIQYRKKDSGQPWQQHGVDQTYPDTSRQDYTQTFEITGVEHDKEYEVRIVVKDSNGVVYGSNDVPSSTIFTGTRSGGIQLTYPPSCYNTDYGVIVVIVTLGVNNPIKGEGPPPAYFTIQYRDETDDENWTDFLTVPYPTYQQYYQRQYTLRGLKSGKVYEIRVILQAADGTKYGDNSVPSYLCGTKCDIPMKYDYDIQAKLETERDRSTTLVVDWTYTLGNARWCPQIGSQVTYVLRSEQHSVTVRGNSIPINNWTANDVLTLFVQAITSGGYASFSDEFVYPPQPGGQHN